MMSCIVPVVCSSAHLSVLCCRPQTWKQKYSQKNQKCRERSPGLETHSNWCGSIQLRKLQIKVTTHQMWKAFWKPCVSGVCKATL